MLFLSTGKGISAQRWKKLLIHQLKKLRSSNSELSTGTPISSSLFQPTSKGRSYFMPVPSLLPFLLSSNFMSSEPSLTILFKIAILFPTCFLSCLIFLHSTYHVIYWKLVVYCLTPIEHEPHKIGTLFFLSYITSTQTNV